MYPSVQLRTFASTRPLFTCRYNCYICMCHYWCIHHFLVQWEGYGYEENMWVPEEDMATPRKVEEFYAVHPGAPSKIQTAAFDSLMSRALRVQQSRRGGDVRGTPQPNSNQTSELHEPSLSSEDSGNLQPLHEPSPSSENSGHPHSYP